MRLIPKLLFACMVFVFAGCVNVRDGYVDVKDLPLPDCSGKNTAWTTFEENAENTGQITVIPDRPSDPAGFARIRACLKNEVKTESELTDEDLGKTLEIYGVLADFNDWERLGVPIVKTANGFRFEGITYEGARDGICTVGERRSVWVGNSSAPVSTLMATMMYYDYMILKDGLLSKMKVKDTPVIDLDRIRESNYDRADSRYYNCFVDKKLNGEALPNPDSIVTDICRKLELPLPDFQINAYLSADPNATRLFSNFFFMTGCDTLASDMRFATVQLGAIHCVGVDAGFIVHESVHYLWERSVPREDTNEFLSEGIQIWYQFSGHDGRFEKALEVQRKYAAHDLRDWILEGSAASFWSGPSENDWPAAYDISGVFVRFLIDGWGMEKFKAFYAFDGKEKGLSSIYGLSLDETLNRYSEWLSGIES